jgi:hypothetical protein
MRALKKESWPYQIEVHDRELDVHEWCIENMGRPHHDWYAYRGTKSQLVIAFKDEADFIVYKLKWGLQ